MGFGGGSVMISVGRDCAEADLKSDWTLTHEMVHLALPNLSRRQHWMEEGMSTYVEPVARTRTGVQPPEAFWSEMIGKLPNGVSAVSGVGLDEGGGWAGTYWGGALYWFMADVAIRERTGNRKGLEDALRGIMSEGTIADSWPVERVLRAGDSATSTTVLTELYERLGRNACTVDLQDYWKRLGVERHGDTIVFDDKAPLAAIRKAIVTPRT
jgi:hypothetical protein